MRASLFEPVVQKIDHYGRPDETEFPVVDITDHSGGTVSLYVGDNWEHWDAMVAAVNEYRSVK
jgi:hypothetical protein